MSDRTLPHNLDAERAVIGAVLIDNDAYQVASEIVQPDQFFRLAHKVIWSHMVQMADAKIGIDLVTLVERLGPGLEAAGGAGYVASLIDGVPRATNVEYYARIVKEKATFRRLILGATSILDAAYSAEDDAEAMLEKAERAILEVGHGTVRSEFMLAEDWSLELSGQIEHAATSKRVITGIPTGFPTLDRVTRGFQRGDLIFIAARPSVGKTSLMMQIAAHAADHVMTGIVSLEMKRRDVGFRLVSTEARVDLYGLQTGFLSNEQYQRVGAALSRIGSKRFAIDDSSGLTDSQLRGKIRRFAARHGLGIVFVDYLQLLSGHGAAENRNLEVAAMSKSLKALAKDLDIPVVVLSQLSRDTAKTNRRPRIDDLRDSGALEQDADMVILLHRPNQQEDAGKYQDGEPAELIIGKQRNGATCLIELTWCGDQVLITESVPKLRAV